MDVKNVPNLYTIMEEWEKDAKLTPHNLPNDIAKISTLHAKYSRYLAHHTLFAKKCMTDYTTLRTIKWDYFSGDLNTPDAIKEYNLPGPFLTVIHSREAKERKIESDKELTNILLKKALHEETAEMCKSIIKELNNRTWQCKTILDWERFYGGSADGSFVNKARKSDDSEP